MFGHTFHDSIDNIGVFIGEGSAFGAAAALTSVPWVPALEDPSEEVLHGI